MKKKIKILLTVGGASFGVVLFLLVGAIAAQVGNEQFKPGSLEFILIEKMMLMFLWASVLSFGAALILAIWVAGRRVFRFFS